MPVRTDREVLVELVDAVQRAQSATRASTSTSARLHLAAVTRRAQEHLSFVREWSLSGDPVRRVDL